MDNNLNARASEIEDAIAAGRMTPVQVFTQMRQLIRAAVRETAIAEARYQYIRARCLSDDMEAPFLPDAAVYANTPEEFDAAIDAAMTGATPTYPPKAPAQHIKERANEPRANRTDRYPY